MIEADAKIEDEAGMNLPTVLDKESEIVRSAAEEENVVIGDSAAEGGVFTKDIDREIGEEALVGGTRKGITER